MRRPARARGFTLVELLIGSTVALVVAAGATLVVAQTSAHYARERKRAALRAQSAQALAVLADDLRHAGLGRPAGPRFDGTHEPFPPSVLVGQAASLSLLGDLPRPDANFDGFSTLSDTQGLLPLDGLALLNELNQGCDPWVSNMPCATNAASLLFGASTPSCGNDPSAPSCPWGLGRYRGGEALVVANGAGNWVLAEVSGARHASTGVVRYLLLSHALPPGFLSATPGGFAATPDRVHYQVSGDRLQRDQCWGPLTTPVSATDLARPCSAGANGTGWEDLASGVSALELSYFDRGGAALPVPLSAPNQARVGRVRARLVLTRALGEETLTDDESVEVTLRTGGPW